jgi:hypothetical protein
LYDYSEPEIIREAVSLCLHIRKCFFDDSLTLNRVIDPAMSRTESFEEAADSFAGWFCECGVVLNGLL